VTPLPLAEVEPVENPRQAKAAAGGQHEVEALIGAEALQLARAQSVAPREAQVALEEAVAGLQRLKDGGQSILVIDKYIERLV
jgi:hypothetical protein